MAVKTVALLVALLAAGVARAEEAKPWWALVPDSYDGAIFSGRGYAQGATEFHRDGAALAGSYAFVEPDGTQIDGTLDRCVSAAPNNIACRWTDRYGSGSVAFVFDETLQSFTGLWFSPKVPKQGMPWTGKRRIGS